MPPRPTCSTTWYGPTSTPGPIFIGGKDEVPGFPAQYRTAESDADGQAADRLQQRILFEREVGQQGFAQPRHRTLGTVEAVGGLPPRDPRLTDLGPHTRDSPQVAARARA